MNTSPGDMLSNNELDSELIIGLVCAVGTETVQVVDLLQERLGRAGYHVEVVKISRDIIPQLVRVQDTGHDKFKRYSSLMDAGNACRALDGTNADDAILAYGAATFIAARRKQLSESRSNKDTPPEEPEKPDYPRPLPKTAFIIDSLKRPEEVEKLRIVYPSGFVLIGIHEDEHCRLKHLINDKGMTAYQAGNLLERDREESRNDHGQRVNATFHLADFFVRLTHDRGRLRFDIQRIVELWFGNPFLTPSFDEHAMFLAFAASLRSADLSRQVGAVVTRDSQILSTGANDCPKSGGGLYWPSDYQQEAYTSARDGVGCALDVINGRDYTRSDGDSNQAEQLRIINKIVDEARREDENFNADLLQKVLRRSGIRDLTEFGRVVHAEMEALLSCARNGISTVGTTLYCTTFPCHNCAKHIVSSGVKRVVYVEPYPKSKALAHHDDSIATTGDLNCTSSDKVVFEPFVGVGPRRFFELFSMRLGSSYPLVRKDRETGKRKPWCIDSAQLRLQMKPVSYLDLELMACQAFGEKLSVVSQGDSEVIPAQ